MKDPMLDEEFLKQLDQYHHHHTWAKIVSLNFDEYPQQEITGRVTSGSINIDGSSALRRTCSLSLVAEDVNIQDFYWGLHTKFYVYIGLENFINPEYPDIIWFKQGMFMITSFSCTTGINNYTISIQGKDKMTLLNGDLGGVIPASWDFGTEDVNATDENGNTVYDTTGYAIVENHQIPIKRIILEAVHEFAQEPWQNIIVNDLDDYGIELLEYDGDKPFYYIIKTDVASGDNNSREVTNMTFNGDMQCQVRLDKWDNAENKRIEATGANAWTDTTLSNIENIRVTDAALANGALCYEKLVEQLDPNGAVTESKDYMRAVVKFEGSEDTFTIAKITNDNGMRVCGYRICDIVYPYDLILNPGETVTAMLDKLVKMLGNFEYFYDVDGRFIFQKKRTYIDVSYNNIINEHSISNEVWANSGEYSSKYSYSFEGNNLLSSIQNTPNFSNLKNDYSLWGARQNGNITIPIHMRYAIDHKPLYYKVIGHQLLRDADGNVYHYLGELEDNNIDKINFNPGNVYYIRETDGTQNDWHGYQINRQNEYLCGWILCQKQEDNSLLFKAEHTYSIETVINEDMYGTQETFYNTDYLFGIQSAEIKESFKKYNYAFIDKNYVYWTAEAKNIYNDMRKYPRIASDSRKHIVVDWREIIYQMANDYRRHYHDIDFLEQVQKNNLYNDYESFYPKGRTGYEQYYIDFEMNLSQGVVAYWRELYNPIAANLTGRYLSYGKFLTLDEEYSEEFNENHSYSIKNKQGIEEKYNGYQKGDKVYLEIEGVKRYWKSTADKNSDKIVTYEYEKNEDGSDKIIDGQKVIKKINYSNKWSEQFSMFTYNSSGWNVNILDNPEVLNFWFDFIDTTGELNKYGVNNIGLRSKATNDDKIKAIYFREVPNVIFETPDGIKTTGWVKPGYCYIQIPAAYMDYFHISSRGKNMMDVVEEYLYSYTYPASSITLTSIPIYYLTPNTLIYVHDDNTGIVGEYIMNKFSIQLGLNATMSINAVETAKRIY